MPKLWLGVLIFLGMSSSALIVFFLWASSGRLPQTHYATVVDFGMDEPFVPTADTITIVSYNVGYLSGLTNNQAVQRSRQLYDDNLATAIAALEAIKPDLLALQEVDLEAARSFRIDQVQAIGQSLDSIRQAAVAINWDKRYVPFPPWPPAAHFGPILSGQAVLSRFPIVRHDRQVLEKVASNPFYYNALYLDRLAQVAEVFIGDRPLIVINVHLEAFDQPTRSRQTQFVRQLAETYAQTHPVILLGDFNSALNREEEGIPRSIQTMLDSAVLAPAVSVAALTQAEQLTFPADSPQYKLDYIFYTPKTLELETVRVLTEAARASDHLPLIVQLQLR